MGLLRFLLALTILMTHAYLNNKNFLFNSHAAVCSFFIISGFYMALILQSNKYKSITVFYRSRLLRIFPLYLITLFTIILLGILKTTFHIGSEENAISHYLNYSNYLKGNAAIIDGINFFMRNITLIINKDYLSINDNLASGYLIVNQAWSLQVELLFYLFVPFLIMLKEKLIYFVIFYLLFFYTFLFPKNIIISNSLTFYFTNYLIFFLLGLLSFNYLYKYTENLKNKFFERIIFVCVILFVVLFNDLPLKFNIYSFPQNMILFFPLALSLPFIFNFTKNNKIDRYLGELSYPVFITHMIFAKIIFSLNLNYPPFLNAVLIAIPTVVFGILLIKFIQIPIDNFRHKNIK